MATNSVDSIGNAQVGYVNPYYGNNIDYTDLGDYSAYNTSIFGPGMLPMCGGYGYDMSNYYDNMKNNQQFMIDYNVDQQNMTRNADLRINASIEAVRGAAMILKDKILANEQDQIMDAYNNYVETVRLAYGKGTDSEVKARANTLYADMNGGKTLYQDIRENAHGSATQGFIQTLTFGLYDRKSAEDNISEISGAPVGTGEKTAHNLGRIAGAGIVGGVGYGIAKFLGSGKAGIWGLAVAGVAALASFITGKVTT